MCFVCAVATLALPAAALAKPGYVLPGRFELFAALPKHDGSSYSISTSDHRHVELRVSRGGAVATYRVEGRASSHDVHADFGPLVHIDLKIDLEGNEPPPYPFPRNCKGKRPAFLSGTYHGTVRFAGEGELAGLTVHRGSVGIEREFKLTCRRHHPRHRHPHTGRLQPGPAIEALALLRNRCRRHLRTAGTDSDLAQLLRNKRTRPHPQQAGGNAGKPPW